LSLANLHHVLGLYPVARLVPAVLMLPFRGLTTRIGDRHHLLAPHEFRALL
jgi:hypothetical protein